MNRELILKDKIQTRDNDASADFTIVLDYNVEYKEVEKTLGHLKKDIHLGLLLPHKPHIVYRRAPTLSNLLVKRAIDPPNRDKIFKPIFLDRIGLFACRCCLACKNKKLHITRKDKQWR